jgi:hypothetical protein
MKGPRAALALVALLAAVLVAAVGVNAADPTPTAAPRQPTCAERYPGEGPAQVDLRLGCIANELVGHYTGGGAGEAVPISSYLGPLLVLVGGFVLLFLVARMALGRASRRLAPAAPGAYWLCPDCQSVNDPTRARCYSCGRPWTAEAATVERAQHPEMVQRFGGNRKSGPN